MERTPLPYGQYNSYTIQAYMAYIFSQGDFTPDQAADEIERRAIEGEIELHLKASGHYQVRIAIDNDPLDRQKTYVYDKPYKHSSKASIISKGKGFSKQYAGRDVLEYLGAQATRVNPRIYEKYKEFNCEMGTPVSANAVVDDCPTNFGTKQWTPLIGKDCYFKWFYDFRGRVYSSGYEIGPHGSELQRYGLDFKKSKKLSKSGLDAVYMHISTLFGRDRELDEKRIELGKYYHENFPPSSIEPSNEPIELADGVVLEKSVAYYKLPDVIEVGMDWNIPVEFDVTNSGLQIMSAITDCESGCKLTNLTHNDQPYDSYTDIADALKITRKQLKKPMISHFYNSTAGTKDALDEIHETLYPNFLKEVGKTFKGATSLMAMYKKLFNNQSRYIWELPDGFKVLMVQVKDGKFAIQNEFFREPFIYEFKYEAANKNFRPLLVNVIHSADAYLNRFIIRAFMARNKSVMPVHDAWLVHPNDVLFLKKSYKEGLTGLLRSRWFDKATAQIFGQKITTTPLNEITSNYFII